MLVMMMASVVTGCGGSCTGILSIRILCGSEIDAVPERANATLEIARLLFQASTYIFLALIIRLHESWLPATHLLGCSSTGHGIDGIMHAIISLARPTLATDSVERAVRDDIGERDFAVVLNHSDTFAFAESKYSQSAARGSVVDLGYCCAVGHSGVVEISAEGVCCVLQIIKARICSGGVATNVVVFDPRRVEGSVEDTISHRIPPIVRLFQKGV